MSLDQTHPDLVAQWHPTLNTKGVTEYSYGSHAKIWWVCPNDHAYQASINRRTNSKTGCPYCANQKVLQGFNDLATTNPELVPEWHTSNPKQPTEVLPGSGQKALWKCLEGHEWSSEIRTRAKKGHGCPYCAGQRRDNILPVPQGNKAIQEWHTDKNGLDISKVHSKSKERYWWICKQGHEWKANIRDRIYGGTECPYCTHRKIRSGFNDLATLYPDLVKEWDRERNEIEPSEISPGSQTLVSWKCTSGHKWVTTPNHRTSSQSGCPKCSNTVSKQEKELRTWLRQQIPQEEVIYNDRETLEGKELDILFPNLKVAIEFNGVYWHSERFMAKGIHSIKYKRCQEQGIQLIQIWSDDWVRKQEVVKMSLTRKLGISQEEKISARELSINQVSIKEAIHFLDSYHLQGSSRGSQHIGLWKGSELYAVASFRRQSPNRYELVRYASKAIVRGGHSKLVAYAQKLWDCELVTFADLEISDGSLYKKTGWEAVTDLPPDYSYLYKGRRIHKSNFRKKHFKENPNLVFLDGLTEAELAQLNSLQRVWDSGKMKFVKSKPERCF